MVTSLIDEFNYPKFGPGMMWEVATEKVTAAGATLEFDRRVTEIRHTDGVVRPRSSRSTVTGSSTSTRART